MKLKHEAYPAVAQPGQTALGEAVDTLAVDEHLAAGGGIQCAHNLEQRGLAGAAAADDAYEFTLTDGEVDALEHLKGAETLVNVLQLYHWPWSG